MDLIIVLLIFVAIIIIRRDIKFLVYCLGAIEIFFRLVHYVGDNYQFLKINHFVNKYIPDSIFSIFSKYTTGIVYDVISFILVIGFIILIYYMIKYLINKK